MKFLHILVILGVGILISKYGYAQSSIDTISVKDSLGQYQLESNKYIEIGWPTRANVSNKLSFITPYQDSIRSCGYMIDKFNQLYYLKVYDKNGILRLAGTFYDCYPIGYIVSYNYHGFKLSEGEYGRIKNKWGEIIYAKIGEWEFYDVRGRLKKKYNYKDSKK